MTIAPDRTDRPTAPGLHGATHPTVTVLVDRCAGCQECVVRCPTEALHMETERWVAVADSSACVGCRQCTRTCPFSAITVDGPMLVADRVSTRVAVPEQVLGDLSETRRGIATWEEAVAEASRCLSCPDPTCVRGCPTHNDIPGFVAAVARRDLDEAHRILRRTTVLPDICSRVCDQAVQCEGSCTWSLAGGTPVAIGALERFIAENVPVPPPAVPSDGVAGTTPADGAGAAPDARAGRAGPRRVTSPRPAPDAGTLAVAVVGSGPAGIAAAWELLEGGAQVTVFERDAAPGGLLGWGIPDFTLPAAVADRPWDQLQAAGVDLRCSSPVDAAGLDSLLAEHDAVVLAHGAGLPVRPPIPGVDLPGVEDATSFLQRARAALQSGERLDDLDRVAARAADGVATVLVLGAGNTAMDVARCARRLGAQAVCVDWMDARFAPVRPDELEEAREEGVEVRFSRTVTAIVGDDAGVTGARLASTRQERADRRPEVLRGSEEPLAVQHVVLAMGYRLDPELSNGDLATLVPRRAEGLPDRQWTGSGILAAPAPPFARHQPVGRLALGREAARASAALPRRERLWVAGDALVGPSTVVEAMAQGREAARAILAHRPHRPGVPRSRVGHVVVGYDSVGARTAACARAVADLLGADGTTVEVLPLSQVDTRALARADLLVVGTWTEGKIVAGVGPARTTRRWLQALPPIAGLRVATFCTYGFDPRGTLGIMRSLVEARGGRVVAEGSFRGRSAVNAATTFAATVRTRMRARDAEPATA